MTDAKKIKIGGTWYNVKDETARNALTGKADSNHNHDSAYAAKSHTHDDRYYTETEMNTKLAGKQDKLTFDTTPTASSTNPVTSGGVKTALDGRVSKSGDTMTGNLGIEKSYQPSLELKQSNTSLGAVTLTDNRMFIREYPADQQQYSEVYQLPVPDSGMTATKWYSILTSKNLDTTPTASSTNPVTSGGVKTALDGKVNISGGTITGNLATTGSSYVIKRDGDKLLRFLNASDQEQGSFYLSNSNHRMAFRMYDDDYSNTELYYLPVPDSLTQNKTYDILTSKTPVTVAQGGTGGTDSGRKSLSNSSVYSGMIYYRKIGVFVYLYFDGVKVRTDISASTIRNLATLPEEYCPTHPSGCSLFGFAGNAGNPGIFSITTSGVIGFTPMADWSVNAIIRGSAMYCI